VTTEDLLAVARVRGLALRALVSAGGQPDASQVQRAARPLLVAAAALNQAERALCAAGASAGSLPGPTVGRDATPGAEVTPPW